MDYKLSIIIPTKDRYKYLLPLIELIDSYNLISSEIVIEDNSYDNSPIRHFLDTHRFTIPIVYNQTPTQLSICDNIDNAIKHSHGRYVTVIGDDDAVTLLIGQYVDWMEENGVDSMRQKRELCYKWPAYTDNTGTTLGGSLTFEELSRGNEEVDTPDAARNVVQRGIMTLGKMPCVYQGIVKRATLDKLIAIGGTYFPGPSPDMGNAMALSFIVDKHVVTSIPVIISGGSEYQGGKSKKIKKWVQPLENIPFISEEAKKAWDKRIPYFWCGHTVWPESGIKGLEYVGQQDLLNHMDWEMLLAKCLYRGPEYKKEILSMTKDKSKVKRLCLKFTIREFLAKRKRQIVSFLGMQPKGLKRVYKLNTIAECVDYLVAEYRKQTVRS